MLTPFEIVQKQLDAYNRRDIEAFIALFAEDARGFDLGSPGADDGAAKPLSAHAMKRSSPTHPSSTARCFPARLRPDRDRS